MIRSMTGFGAGHGASGGEELDVEVRSVNHKFCEVKVRTPRELAARALDAARAVKERLARGGVEVSIRRPGPAGGLAPRVDVALAQSYARAFAEIAARTGLHESSVRRILYDLARRFAESRERTLPATTAPPGPAR